MVKEVTMDLSNSMNLIVCRCFPKASRTIDRFHVQKLACDALQEMRIAHRWDAIQEEADTMEEARHSGKAAPCRVANVLRYEWNVIFLVIPAERIHSFMRTWVQHRFSPLNTKPFLSGEYSISFRASLLMGMMSSFIEFCVQLQFYIVNKIKISRSFF